MFSLRQRFQRFWGMGLCFIFVLQWGLSVWVLDKSTDAYVVSRLRHDHESLLTALNLSEAGVPVLNLQKVNPIFEQPFSGHYYRVRVQGIDLYSHSLWHEDLPFPPLASGEQISQEVRGPRGQKLMVYSAGYRQQNMAIEIMAAEDLTPLQANIGLFSWAYAVLSLILLLIMLKLQRVLLEWSLRPLTQIQQDLDALAQGERQQLSEQVPTEILPLIQAFNRLLGVLDQRLQRSRNALANLAHALKKPLTLMYQTLAHRGEQTPEPLAGLETLKVQLAQIQALIEHELRRGQLAGAASGGEQIELAKELPLLLQLLTQSYPHKKVTVTQDIALQHAFAGDRQDLLELCGNVLDNAFKWANTQIWVQMTDKSGLELVIADDGPGCPPELRQHLLHRGARLDRSQSGHGFGLAIAQEIVQAYGGEIHFSESERLGGLEVRVILPERMV